jgi:hypothetical protein
MAYKINDQATWWQAEETVVINDQKLGLIRVSQWKQLHFKTAANQKLNLIKVERLNPKKTGNVHRALWLIWVGEVFLSLEKVWSQYAGSAHLNPGWLAGQGFQILVTKFNNGYHPCPASILKIRCADPGTRSD